MARNGSGVYSLPAGNPVVDGTTIEASWANTTLSDIGTEITGSLPRNGAAPMTGALGMGSNKILNLADGTAATDAATKGQTDSALAAHVAAADPHPGYLTEVAAAAAYQPLDADLTAIAGLTSAADKVPYFTGSGTAAVADFSSNGRSIVASPACAVYAVKSSDQSVSGTWSTIVFGEVLDAGSNFASSTFTAPATGVYLLNLRVYKTGATNAIVRFLLNGTTQIASNLDSGGHVEMTAAVSLTAGDTVVAQYSGTATLYGTTSITYQTTALTIVRVV